MKPILFDSPAAPGSILRFLDDTSPRANFRVKNVGTGYLSLELRNRDSTIIESQDLPPAGEWDVDVSLTAFEIVVTSGTSVVRISGGASDDAVITFEFERSGVEFANWVFLNSSSSSLNSSSSSSSSTSLNSSSSSSVNSSSSSSSS